jgi:hypothetical protein
MRKTVLVLAALAAMSGTAFAKDTSAALQYPDATTQTAGKQALDQSVTGSIRHGMSGKLLPRHVKDKASAGATRPSGIEINPWFPNPH